MGLLQRGPGGSGHQDAAHPGRLQEEDEVEALRRHGDVLRHDQLQLGGGSERISAETVRGRGEADDDVSDVTSFGKEGLPGGHSAHRGAGGLVPEGDI